jgi:hypothetical protein
VTVTNDREIEERERQLKLELEERERLAKLEIEERERQAKLEMEEQQRHKELREEKLLQLDLERLQLAESPALSTSPGKSVGGNDSITSVSSSASLQSIISDAEEEKSKTNKYTKDVRVPKTEPKRLSWEKFSPQKEAFSSSPFVESPPPAIPLRPVIPGFHLKGAELPGPSTSLTQTGKSDTNPAFFNTV